MLTTHSGGNMLKKLSKISKGFFCFATGGTHILRILSCRSPLMEAVDANVENSEASIFSQAECTTWDPLESQVPPLFFFHIEPYDIGSVRFQSVIFLDKLFFKAHLIQRNLSWKFSRNATHNLITRYPYSSHKIFHKNCYFFIQFTL